MSNLLAKQRRHAVALTSLVSVLVVAGWSVRHAVSASSSSRIVFFGDSLTAGYGLQRSQAFPALIYKKIVGEGLRFEVLNAGKSGETTAGGLRRIVSYLDQPVAVLALELGVNDSFRGVSTETIHRNLQEIIDLTQDRWPKVKILILGMEAAFPPTDEYARRFREIFPRLAHVNGAALVPFLLEGVAGRPSLNLADGLHPNSAGQKIISDQIWPILREILHQSDGN